MAVLLLAAQTAFGALPFFRPDQAGEAQTVNGESYWLEKIELSTPRDYDKAAAGEPAYRFESSPTNIPFGQIQQIVVNPLTRRWFGSRPEAMEYYPLGSVRQEVPPPPNWKRTYGQSPAWKRAQAAGEVGHLPFLNHAVFCWTDGAEASAARQEAGVYLFRQKFTIGTPTSAWRPARATLHLATNADLLEVSLNEQPLHLPPHGARLLASFEVTPLARRGANLIAVRVREKPGTLSSNYGLAFSMEWVESAAASASSSDERHPAMALASGRNGDRVWGWIESLQGDQVLLKTLYGPYRQDLTQLNGLLLPAGWFEPPGKPGVIARLTGSGRQAEAGVIAGDLTGLPLEVQPEPLQDRLLLTEGRETNAEPAYARGEDLVIESTDGKRYSIKKDVVRAIYPPRPVDWTFRKPAREDAALHCRLTTTDGERIGGMLRQFNGSQIVLEADGNTILEFRPEKVASLAFPYHAPPARGQRGPVALIAQTAGQEAYRATFLADTLDVQEAAFSIGAPVATLELATLIDAEALDPDKLPVLVSVDPVGEYLHSLERPGDGQGTLIRYLERGGVLIVLSRGGAFRTALIRGAGGLRRSADEVQSPSLAGQLGLATIRPEEKPPEGAAGRAFNHPPNVAQEVFFERASEAPQGLLGLPRRVALDPMLTARFYPMVSTQRAGRVIYEVRDETGMTYGPALSLIPKGRGTIVIVDHLLWNSRPDGEPFSERILPALLRWALEAGGQ